jgi:two-component system, OmpR family, alkaline phosphatase synthesis response regulator PhoP
MARVLTADDDPAILEILNAYLTKDGHEVVLAINGLDAELELGSVDLTWPSSTGYF